jgi:hypothetical protein
MQLARQKLDNHGGRHRPMAAMVSSPWHRRILQLANMLCDKSVIKTREYYCFYFIPSYFKVKVRRILACRACVCWLRMMKTREPNQLNQ